MAIEKELTTANISAILRKVGLDKNERLKFRKPKAKELAVLTRLKTYLTTIGA